MPMDFVPSAPPSHNGLAGAPRNLAICMAYAGDRIAATHPFPEERCVVGDLHHMQHDRCRSNSCRHLFSITCEWLIFTLMHRHGPLFRRGARHVPGQEPSPVCARAGTIARVKVGMELHSGLPYLAHPDAERVPAALQRPDCAGCLLHAAAQCVVPHFWPPARRRRRTPLPSVRLRCAAFRAVRSNGLCRHALATLHSDGLCCHTFSSSPQRWAMQCSVYRDPMSICGQGADANMCTGGTCQCMYSREHVPIRLRPHVSVRFTVWWLSQWPWSLRYSLKDVLETPSS